jgi:hypothetical protein
MEVFMYLWYTCESSVFKTVLSDGEREREMWANSINYFNEKWSEMKAREGHWKGRNGVKR